MNSTNTMYQLFNEDCVLYHGSRGGIVGDIDLAHSRERTDFGRGFYMQTNIKQAKAWVAGELDPRICGIEVDLRPYIDDVLVLEDRAWIFTVLHNRRMCDAFNGTKIDKAMDGFLDGFDFVIGPIADDRLGKAIDLFSENALTDEGLFECLTRVSHGMQIVAKTPEACQLLRIEFEERIHEAEADALDEFRRQKRQEGREIYKTIQEEYRGKGLYLSDLLKLDIADLHLNKSVPNKKVLLFADTPSVTSLTLPWL